MTATLTQQYSTVLARALPASLLPHSGLHRLIPALAWHVSHEIHATCDSTHAQGCTCLSAFDPSTPRALATSTDHAEAATVHSHTPVASASGVKRVQGSHTLPSHAACMSSHAPHGSLERISTETGGVAGSAAPTAEATAADADDVEAATCSSSGIEPPAATYAKLAASVYKATEEVVGPLSLGDLVFGLQAVAKKHRQQQLSYLVQGSAIVADTHVVSALLDAADLAYAAYKVNPQSACAVSHLRLHNLRKFVPHNSRLRPAYFIAVDHRERTIIWAIRGTKNVTDIITDISGASTVLDGGRVHWGMLQAAQALLHEEMSHLSALSKALPGYQVQLVGHSLGAGVAAIVTYLLNYRPSLRRQLRACPKISATIIASPPVMSAGLAVATERFVTCLIYCHDPVPRMTPAAVQHLRAELLEVDWAAQLKSSLLAAEYTRAITDAIDSASTGTAQAAAQLQKLASELLQSRHIQQLTSALNAVVYGRNEGLHPITRSSRVVGGDGSSMSELVQHLQQVQEDEELHEQQWRQHASSSQHTAIESWQADVIRSWVNDVTDKLLPFVKDNIKLPDADLSRVAEAAVTSLTSSLKLVAFGHETSSNKMYVPDIPAAANQLLTTIRSAGQLLIFRGSSDDSSRTTSGSSSSDSTSFGIHQLQRQPSAAVLYSFITRWKAGQLVTACSNSDFSGSSSGLLDFLGSPDDMMQYWKNRLQHSQQDADLNSRRLQQTDVAVKDAGADRMTSASLPQGHSPSMGVTQELQDKLNRVADQLTADAAPIISAATAAAAAVGDEIPGEAAEGDAARLPVLQSPAGVESAPEVSRPRNPKDDIVDMFPPGRLLFLIRSNMLAPKSHNKMQQQQQHDLPNGNPDTYGRRHRLLQEHAGATLSAVELPLNGVEASAHGGGSDASNLPQAADSCQFQAHVTSSSRPQQPGTPSVEQQHESSARLQQQPAGGNSQQDHSSSRGSSTRSVYGGGRGTKEGFRGLPGACRPPDHVLLEVERIGNFDRLVLHPQMFKDHRTSSYRAALLELLKRSASAAH